MKDRFKLRAWSDEYNRYLDKYDIYNETLATDYSIYTLLDFYVDSNKFTFEQCTGLKDKNGKLIYEGDILQNGNFIRRVVYAEGQFRVVGCRDCIPLYLCNNDLEIVGNIHENLELLEDNK